MSDVKLLLKVLHSSSISLIFLGERPLERVCVEVLLVKQSHKRRKESTGSVERTALGTSEVPVNPSEDHPPSKAPALSVSSEALSEGGGAHHHQARCSYTLVLRVRNSSSSGGGTVGAGSLQNGEENLEPAAKRRKLLRGSIDDGKVCYCYTYIRT